MTESPLGPTLDEINKAYREFQVAMAEGETDKAYRDYQVAMGQIPEVPKTSAAKAAKEFNEAVRRRYPDSYPGEPRINHRCVLVEVPMTTVPETVSVREGLDRLRAVASSVLARAQELVEIIEPVLQQIPEEATTKDPTLSMPKDPQVTRAPMEYDIDAIQGYMEQVHEVIDDAISRSRL